MAGKRWRRSLRPAPDVRPVGLYPRMRKRPSRFRYYKVITEERVMLRLCRLLPWSFVLVCWLAPVAVAAPFTCEELQERIATFKATIKKKSTSAEQRAEAQDQLDRTVKYYDSRCAKQKGGAAPTHPALLKPPEQTPQAAYPEEEIARRREAINAQSRQFDAKPKAQRAAAGQREIPVPHALPLTGSILLESGANATFYAAIKQELAYTIREAFVGNLIVTRYYDPAAGRYTGREEYAIQTLSTEIDVVKHSGRACVQYAGTPAACKQWHPLDIWELAEGEEYPGRNSGVVSAVSDGPFVNIRVDAPDVNFSSSKGGVTMKSACGDLLRETVKRDEFKEWMRRGTARIKREVGKTGPGCRPGSTMTLELHFGAKP